MRTVCKHWGWKLFTPNIWQVGNNNKICSQNSRPVCNQNVCVFIVYIIHLRSRLLRRRRVRSWFLEVVCSCTPCSVKLFYICNCVSFQECWHFFKPLRFVFTEPEQDAWLWQERIYWIIVHRIAEILHTTVSWLIEHDFPSVDLGFSSFSFKNWRKTFFFSPPGKNLE